jgi:hypothetical protein
MTFFLEKNTNKQNQRVASKVVTLQEDLSRLSGIVTHLAGLSEEDLINFDVADQMDSIHKCLKRFETCSIAIQAAAYENEFAEPFVDEDTFGELDSQDINWENVRKEARRARKLSNQLTLTLTKIRFGMEGIQTPSHAPEEFDQINQVVLNAVSGMALDWKSNLG